MKKTGKNAGLGMCLGMCFGTSIGMSIGMYIGSLFDKMSIGMCIGMSIGVSFGSLLGLVIGSEKDKKVNQQLEEQGYAVKEIEQKDENHFTIVIENKMGELKNVEITNLAMKEQNFAIGDLVFLDDDGKIEQALDKEEK